MSERVARMDLASGDLTIMALDEAVSELSGTGLYSEIAPRLREGNAVQLPNGLTYRVLASLSDHAFDLLPPGAAS
jgi:hypothetical protein